MLFPKIICSVQIVCMVVITYVYGFWVLWLLFLNPSLLLCWMFVHDCLDTCRFGCIIYMCFVFLYLLLFSATQHVSRGRALWKYAHHYYNAYTRSIQPQGPQRIIRKISLTTDLGRLGSMEEKRCANGAGLLLVKASNSLFSSAPV